MAIGRKPASISRSIPCTWRGESSGIFNLPCGRGRTRHSSFLDDWRLGSGICLGGTPFELRQDFAQRRDQLVPGNVAFLELNRSEEHTSELQSRLHLVCRLLLEKKNHAI